MVNLIEENIAEIRSRISEAAKRSGRRAEDVKLMGVSKFHPIEMMTEASSIVDILGENRIQEASDKRNLWPKNLTTPWHLIGHLQRNKARKALEIFSVIETVDSLDLARMLDRILAETDVPSYSVFLEVNMSKEASKDGVDPLDAPYLAERIVEYCPRIAIDGLMTIGPHVDDEASVRCAFAGLRELREKIQSSIGRNIPELSMGMSGDYEIAIEEGSTIVRVGTGIFGIRA